MSRFRWTLAVAALAACWATRAVVGRPAASGSRESEEESAELRPGAGPVAVPANALSDPDSAFGRALRARLYGMSDSDLSAVQNSLAAAVPDAPVEDQEMMMGDMPSSSSSSSSSADDTFRAPCPDSAEQPTDGVNATEARMRRRESTESVESVNNNNSPTLDKKIMIQNIQAKVMNLFHANGRTLPSPDPPLKIQPGLPNTPTFTNQQTDALRLLHKNVKNLPTFPATLFMEKTQSFYPICDIPKHTHEDVWNAKDLMNLLFNISFPKPASGNSVNVSVAKLRLYKQLVSCNSQTSNETTDDFPNCQPFFSEETTKLFTGANLSSSAEVSLITEDKQIRVTVYLYTRSLRKKRVKRKLLDSRMLLYFDEKWTEWNIGNAVKAWRRDPNRNYGLSIEVEDEDGNLLPVNKFFRPMNCTGEVQMTTPKPLPGFLIEQAQRDFGSMGGTDPRPNASALEAFSFNLYRYPMIDVTTIEVPDSEVNNAMLFQYAKSLVEQNLAGRAPQANGSPGQRREPEELDQTELHRIRHGGNGRHRANTTADPSDAAGREFRDRIVMKSVVYKNPKAPAHHPTDAPAESS